MVITVFTLIYITAVSYLYGLLLYRGLAAFLHRPSSNSLPFALTTLGGICFITALASIASFFIPITTGFHSFLAVGAFAYTIWDFRQLYALLRNAIQFIKKNPWVAALFVFAFAAAVYQGSNEPFNFDTGLYHAQFIRWTETYPIVPGLGNFSDRLAFNSSWLMFAAVFHLAWILPYPFHAPGLVLYLLLIIEACRRLVLIMGGNLSIPNLSALLFLPLTLILFNHELSSPGTDLPAALLVWLILVFSLDLLTEIQTLEPEIHSALLLILAAFALTVKLSCAPVILLPAFVWISQRTVSWGSILKNLAAPFFLLFPWFGRNIILSGYLVYPYPQIDLFTLAWKIPFEKAYGAQQWIKAWARVPARAPEEVFGYSFRVWTMEWWSKQTPLNHAVFIAAILITSLCLAGFLINLWKGKSVWFTGNRPYWVVLAIGVAGGIYWFWQAPDFRFGYSFLGYLIVLPIAWMASTLLKNHASISKWIFTAALFAMAAHQVITLAEMTDITLWRSRWYVATPYPTSAIVEFTQHDFNYFMPDQGVQCWYEAIPCNPYPNADARLRGLEIGEGFIDATSNK